MLRLAASVVAAALFAPVIAFAQSMEPNNSRVGFRGTEPLGSGLKVIWQIEQSTDRCEDVANIIEGIVLENA